jgi:hypothetical protein
VPAAREVADLEEILKESDACGVGFIASLKNTKSHRIIKEVCTSSLLSPRCAATKRLDLTSGVLFALGAHGARLHGAPRRLLGRQ